MYQVNLILDMDKYLYFIYSN